MRDIVDEVLLRSGRVATREQLLRVLTRGQLDDELRRGQVVSPFPRVYLRPWDADQQDIRERAGVLSVGRPAALSHTSALRRLELPTVDDDLVHVTTTTRRHPLGRTPGLRVHRTRVRTRLETLAGVPIVAPATAIARSWPLLPVRERRAPAIVAVRDKIVTPDQLVAAYAHTIGMTGRGEFGSLLGLLAAGCESELEIWGLRQVFDVPGLAHGNRQRWVEVGGRRYRIDIAFDEERVAIELDGERWHSSPEQRERDRRRDAALATIDWLTLRFSWDRLHYDVDGCRRDALATLATRRYRRLAG